MLAKMAGHSVGFRHRFAFCRETADEVTDGTPSPLLVVLVLFLRREISSSFFSFSSFSSSSSSSLSSRRASVSSL